MTHTRSRLGALAALLLFATALAAQAPAPAPGPSPAPAAPADATADANDDAFAPRAGNPLEPLAWLAGCWRGTVNKREFREHWLPLRGHVMIGASQTALDGQIAEFEYLRLEPRPNGVYYVANPSNQKEASFRLDSVTKDGEYSIFTFVNPEHDFPQRIVYRRGTVGWLYVHVEGTVKGAERRVIYPMRRVDCEGGEVVTK